LKQKELLESFITQKVDGIAILGAQTATFLTETINKAIARASRCDLGLRCAEVEALAYYGVDDFAGGQVSASRPVRFLNGKGKVAIITSVGATNLERRLGRHEDALAKPRHPDVRRFSTSRKTRSAAPSSFNRHRPVPRSGRVAVHGRLGRCSPARPPRPSTPRRRKLIA